MSDRSILPPNATPVELALEEAIARSGPDLSPIAQLMNPETCPAHLLGWLAWAMSVDTWDSGWSEGVKREVIRSSVPVHRLKGTRKAVMAALEALGFNVDLTEWWQEAAPPHTFRLDAYGEDVLAAGFQIDEQLLDTVTRIIENAKPARSHFTFRIGESFRQEPTLKNGLRQQRRHTAELSPNPRPHETASAPGLASGLAAIRRDRRSLSPVPRPHDVVAHASPRAGLRARLLHRATLTVQPREGAAYAR